MVNPSLRWYATGSERSTSAVGSLSKHSSALGGGQGMVGREACGDGEEGVVGEGRGPEPRSDCRNVQNQRCRMVPRKVSSTWHTWNITWHLAHLNGPNLRCASPAAIKAKPATSATPSPARCHLHLLHLLIPSPGRLLLLLQPHLPQLLPKHLCRWPGHSSEAGPWHPFITCPGRAGLQPGADRGAGRTRLLPRTERRAWLQSKPDSRAGRPGILPRG
jgi:hypothetical protein